MESATNKTVKFTILVASLARGGDLREFLESLKKTGYLARPDTEVIIVCGSPLAADAHTAETLAREYGARFLREPRMTKPYCLNAGLKAARGEYIAFTDDDVVVTERDWLDTFERRFAENPLLGYSSGNVIAYNPENPAADLWEKKGGLSKGTAERYWSRAFLAQRARHFLPLPLHKMCAGANCMIPRRVLEKVGPYNVLLETPYIPHGSTLDIGYKIARAGYELLYNPAAFVYHKHPENLPAISKKLFGYGIGDTAVHMNFFIRFGDFRSLWWALCGHAGYSVAKLFRRACGRYPLPFSHILNGLRGNLIGWARFLKVYYMRCGKQELAEAYDAFYR